MGAILQLQNVTGTAPGTAAVVTQLRHRTDASNTADNTAPITIPPQVESFLTAPVVASESAQNAEILSSSFFSAGIFVLVDPGGANQEVVELVSVPSSSTLRGVFRRAHSQGEAVVQVNAATPKVMRMNVSVAPAAALTNLRFARVTSLPTGVYEQYRVLSSYTEFADSDPIPSALTWARLQDESAATVFLEAGPVTIIGERPVFVAVQRLYAFDANPCPLNYAFLWDEA